MSRRTVLLLTITGLCLASGLAGCNLLQMQESRTTPSSSPATTARPSQPAIAAPSSPSSKTGNSSPPSATSSPVASSSPQSTAAKLPLTVEKLKNAEYYFLAQGPIKLTNGKYEDPATKRTYMLDETVAYGDLNQDGIKDAVASLKVFIPNSGDFSYLVAVLNENGKPKNSAAEFLGARIKVKTLTIQSDASIEAVMQQYRPGDPECCPSLNVSRIYKLRSNQPANTTQPPPKNS